MFNFSPSSTNNQQRDIFKGTSRFQACLRLTSVIVLRTTRSVYSSDPCAHKTVAETERAVGELAHNEAPGGTSGNTNLSTTSSRWSRAGENQPKKHTSPTLPTFIHQSEEDLRSLILPRSSAPGHTHTPRPLPRSRDIMIRGAFA